MFNSDEEYLENNEYNYILSSQKREKMLGKKISNMITANPFKSIIASENKKIIQNEQFREQRGNLLDNSLQPNPSIIPDKKTPIRSNSDNSQSIKPKTRKKVDGIFNCNDIGDLTFKIKNSIVYRLKKKNSIPGQNSTPIKKTFSHSVSKENVKIQFKLNCLQKKQKLDDLSSILCGNSTFTKHDTEVETKIKRQQVNDNKNFQNKISQVAKTSIDKERVKTVNRQAMYTTKRGFNDTKNTQTNSVNNNQNMTSNYGSSFMGIADRRKKNFRLTNPNMEKPLLNISLDIHQNSSNDARNNYDRVRCESGDSSKDKPFIFRTEGNERQQTLNDLIAYDFYGMRDPVFANFLDWNKLQHDKKAYSKRRVRNGYKGYNSYLTKYQAEENKYKDKFIIANNIRYMQKNQKNLRRLSNGFGKSSWNSKMATDGTDESPPNLHLDIKKFSKSELTKRRMKNDRLAKENRQLMQNGAKESKRREFMEIMNNTKLGAWDKIEENKNNSKGNIIDGDSNNSSGINDFCLATDSENLKMDNIQENGDNLGEAPVMKSKFDSKSSYVRNKDQQVSQFGENSLESVHAAMSKNIKKDILMQNKLNRSLITNSSKNYELEKDINHKQIISPSKVNADMNNQKKGFIVKMSLASNISTVKKQGGIISNN